MTTNSDFFKKRRAGVLLHITSLPGTPGNGDLGKQAYYFVNFLKECGLSVWQTLPISPPHVLSAKKNYQDFLSPYQCQSAHAGNPLLISLEGLVDKGWLVDADISESTRQLDAIQYRRDCLKKAYVVFSKCTDDKERPAYDKFIKTHKHWLDDYARFRALKDKNNHEPWWNWPPEHRDYSQALEEIREDEELKKAIEQYRFEQFVFFSQWQKLKNYAHEHGVYLFGDMPIFVAEDSVDVWAQGENFLLDETTGRAKFVAGAPPDYFSSKGQCWGNPIYNWEHIQANGFQWWLERFRTLHQLFDSVRLSHFCGFQECYAIPNTNPIVNKDGHWIKDLPGEALFTTLQDEQRKWDSPLSLVAETVGMKDRKDVIALRDKFKFPGIRILQLGFDSGTLKYGKKDNPHSPHNIERHHVVYTGTHDNNTTLGWFQELEPKIQREVCEYLRTDSKDMPWALIEKAFETTASLVIIPMQDILGGDARQRMNIPGTSEGNWRWRFDWGDLQPEAKKRLCRFVENFGR
jgi:4-alpha-glucanotransferase